MSAAFSHDGTRVVTASEDQTARVWNVDGSNQAVLEGHVGSVLSAAFNIEGSRVVTASEDRTARVWSLDDPRQPIVVFRDHEQSVKHAAFSKDGDRVVTASEDGTARVWNVDGSGEPVVLRHEGPVSSATFSADGKRVVTASLDKTVRVWSLDLLPLLWKGTPFCLSPENRIELLGQGVEMAEKGSQRCQKMVQCLLDGGDSAYRNCYWHFRRSQAID